MMLKPKSVLSLTPQQQKNAYLALALLSLILVLHVINRKSTSIVDSAGVPAATVIKEAAVVKPPKICKTDVFVPASDYSGLLKKPLELSGNQVACPERGGKNTQCGKVSAEYHFQAQEPGDYYLYVQVTAPDLNANSLWIGLIDGASQKTFDECKNPSGEDAGPLIPHKHLTSSKQFLCCPAYLAKNKKKGLAGFYSDCCFGGLGKDSNEKACVLDLEVDDQPRWNELPRVFRTSEPDEIIVVRLYAREDGTSWSALVMSSKSNLDEKVLNKLKKA